MYQANLFPYEHPLFPQQKNENALKKTSSGSSDISEAATGDVL